MRAEHLKVGHAYYQVTYADRHMTIPGVEPMIYVGTNVFDSERDSPEPLYAFQDTVSFFRFGLFTEYNGPSLSEEDAPRAYSFTEDQLRELEDLAGAVGAVQAALARSQQITDG